MKFVSLYIITLLSCLEVASQQLPEWIVVSHKALRFTQEVRPATIKILQGDQTAHPDKENLTGVLGSTSLKKQQIIFKPLVPFSKDAPYTLFVNNEIFVFTIPTETTTPEFRITQFYPNTPEVPANVLKWYISFSKAVNPAKIYDHISFLDETGAPIDRSILNLGAPLLSQDGRLLTVWIEPGRQKQLLGPNLELGSVFTPFKNYSLHIAHTLKDQEGKTLAKSEVHHFRTTPADRLKPSLLLWKILKPDANTKQPLRIYTNEQLDYGSLLDAFAIHFKGKMIKGQLEWKSNTNLIEFIPQSPWKQGAYTIQLKKTLEDVAGNNLIRLFDHPLKENQEEAPLLILPFEVD